jgi:APA family basic amino acid/polyamine antiporter
MAFWNRRKSIDEITRHAPGRELKKTLSWPHLMALGVGAIVGTGIYTLVGTAAGMAGPAVMLSFALAGAVCACAALSYAELATMMPAAGSAYTYTYAVLGEGLAWIVGWSLMLEYTLVCAAVATGWSAHVAEFLRPMGVPAALLDGPFAHGLVNLPAVFISLAVAALLAFGTRESATINVVLVVIKIAALAVFVAIAAPFFDARHFHPFFTHGWSEVANGVKLGVAPAAAIIFFAFYGFDAVSTAAEEAKRPGRDLTIGIIGSMVVCTVVYMAVAATAIGAIPVAQIASNAAPLVYVMDALGKPDIAKLVAGAAVVALPTVILAFMYGQSRIYFVMSRDGLLPHSLSRVSDKNGAPVVMTLVTGVVAAIFSGFLPLDKLAAMANAGTLCAFIAVGVCMMVLRVTDAQRPRVFRAPLWWLIGPAGIAGCLYLFWSLPDQTKVLFFGWNAVGLVVYLLFSVRSSRLGKGETA